jgi:hypothetical protein
MIIPTNNSHKNVNVNETHDDGTTSFIESRGI